MPTEAKAASIAETFLLASATTISGEVVLENCVCVDFGGFRLAADRLRPAIGPCSARWRVLGMNCTHPPGAGKSTLDDPCCCDNAGERERRGGRGRGRGSQSLRVRTAVRVQKEKGCEELKNKKQKSKKGRRGGASLSSSTSKASLLNPLPPPYFDLSLLGKTRKKRCFFCSA